MVITVCIRVHDIVDLERDHVNPAVRAVGKSEVEMQICILLPSFRERG